MFVGLLSFRLKILFCDVGFFVCVCLSGHFRSWVLLFAMWDDNRDGGLRPMDAEQLREHAHKMVDFIADYYKSIENFPVLSQVEVFTVSLSDSFFTYIRV
jgi:hypothetical protein